MLERLRERKEWMFFAALPKTDGRLASIAADATAQSTVYYTPSNDRVQRQGSYGLLGTPHCVDVVNSSAIWSCCVEANLGGS